MSYCRVFTAVFASAAMLSATACISAPKETVVSKTTYTAVAQEEHRVLPENLSILTLEEAQNIAVQNNPTFKNAYFAIASARAASSTIPPRPIFTRRADGLIQASSAAPIRPAVRSLSGACMDTTSDVLINSSRDRQG